MATRSSRAEEVVVLRNPVVVVGFVAAMSTTGTLWADTITLGGQGAPTIAPFSGAADLPYAGPYQLIYTGAAFGGLFSVEGVAFKTHFTEQLASRGASNSFTLSVGTTSAAPARPGSSFATNRRSDLTAVFSGIVTVPVAASDRFDFVVPFATPFVFDPSLGNLLLDVFITTPAEEQSDHWFRFLLETGLSADVGAVFANFDTPEGSGIPNYGLLTQFSGTRVSLEPTPEPGTLMLILLGVTGLVSLGGQRAIRNVMIAR